MKIRTQLLAISAVLAMVASLGVVAASPAGAVVTFNVANDHVTCNTLTGTITFATALKNSGTTTGANTITVKGTVGGCTDSDNSSVKMFKGALATTISSNNGTNCSGLLGPTNITGSARITWTPAAGQKFTPTVTVGSAQKPVSDITFSQVSGGVFTVPSSESPWNASYGKFSIGAAFGTAPLGVTSDFTGGDTGATSWFSGTTQQDLGNILTSCSLATGLKTVTFGIGAVHGG
jgi:hypothetical protein